MMTNEYLLAALVFAAIAYIVYRIRIRLHLSRAKHPSLQGHAKISRRVARLIPFFEYDENRFFNSDGAPEGVSRQRKRGFERLAAQLREQSPKTIAFNQSLEPDISDVQFTNAYRVPFPYRNYVRKNLHTGAIAEETEGVKIRDLDGNWSYDLTGAYGVNVFGYDFYKQCMQSAVEKVGKLGPVLGPYHPLIRENVQKLKTISGLDEVSFHMSGTEAVMQAVRLARYHTGKTHLVKMCGAYHGWWDGVQPGIGNQRKSRDVYTLKEMDNQTLHILDTRDDIACVLINPLQALHPNSGAPSDGALVASDRKAQFDRASYTDWLQRLRKVCSRRGIVLIIDDVFTGFRLACRGAQEYFDVQADMVTYGKTLGGGFPVGVLCGRKDLMKRFRDNQPVNVSFARGTFNSHPYVIAAMNTFLHHIEKPEVQAMYAGLDEQWDGRVKRLNQQLTDAGLPIHIANLSSIWTVTYTQPCRYNWMYQFYLRAEGISLSWVGSGRIIMSLNFSDREFNDVISRFVQAATRMQQDGWWWQGPQLNNKWIKREMLKEMLSARFPKLPKCLQPQTEPMEAQPAREQ